MVLLYQNHLAVAVVPLVLTHRVARGRAAPLSYLSFEFEACEPFLHMCSSLRPDPNGQMRLLRAKDP